MELNLPLIDHHCHGLVLAPLSLERFGALISESFRAPPPGTSAFDKPLGLAIRYRCAPLLDLNPGCSAESYVQRRLELGPEQVASRFLKAVGASAFLVDTGHRATDVSTPDQVAQFSGSPAHEIVRIEAVFEAVAAQYREPKEILANFADALADRAREAVGLKSVASYRVTFAFDPSRPSEAEVLDALGSWIKQSEKKGAYRLDHPVLIRYVLWTAAELSRARRLPLQLHVGFGDPDVLMHACDPTHFTDFIRAMEQWSVPIMLLHNYPFIREAGWLSEVFQNVYYDVGAILNYAGPSAQRIMDEAMELGPFTKHLYSSDAFGLPELHYLGAIQFRKTLNCVIERWVGDGVCNSADADAIAHLIAAGNARRIYQLS